MSISKTTDDITTKAIVMELENGQITYIPKLLLNARGKPAEEMAKDKKKSLWLPHTRQLSQLMIISLSLISEIYCQDPIRS